MKQSYNYYLIKNNKELPGTVESFLKHKLRCPRVTRAYLVLFAFAPVLSVEMILLYFPMYSYSAVQKQMSRLEKNGYLKKHSLAKNHQRKYHDSRSKSAFTLSNMGYRYIKEELPAWHRRTNNLSERYLIHYYSCGNAFLSFLTSGININSYLIEKKVNKSTNRKVGRYDLFADAVCLSDDKILYIEQDMGKEHAGIVREKIDRYAWFYDGMKDELRDTIIVLLFKKPYHTPTLKPRYNMNNLDTITTILDDYENMVELYQNLDRTGIDPKVKRTVRDFIRNLPASTDKLFTADDVRDFIDSFFNYTNIYYTLDYNQYQEEYTNKKRWELLYEYYYNYLTFFSNKVMTHYMYHSAWFLMRKADCYMFSSLLFKNLLPYIYNMNTNHEKVLRRYADRYVFEGIHEFSNWSNDIRRFENEDRDGEPELHNCYLIGRHVISFEYPDISIGSFLRCLHIRYKYKGDNLTLILCVLNENNAKLLTQKYYKIKKFNNTVAFSGYNIYFLNIEDFSKPEPTLYVLDETGSRQPIGRLYNEKPG